MGQNSKLIPPTRLQRLAAWPMYWFWSLICLWMPTSWWFNRANDPKRAEWWATFKSKAWGWYERTQGRL